MIVVNEAEPALRVVSVRLVGADGAGIPANHAWQLGEVKVRRPGPAGGAFVNAVNLPVAVAGGSPGSFDLQLAPDEVAARGAIRVQFAPTGGPVSEHVDEIREHVLDDVVDPLAAPGSGRTARECINLIAAWASGDARGLDGPVGSIDSLASEATQRVKRIEFTVQSGRRTVTQRRGQ